MTPPLEATNNWSVNIDNGPLSGVVYIDLKKAFDTIDHAIILRKLTNYGLANTLSFNIAKTEFMVIGSRQKFLAKSYDEIKLETS